MVCSFISTVVLLFKKIVKIILIAINAFIESGNPITAIFGKRSDRSYNKEYSEFKATLQSSTFNQACQLFIPRLTGVIFQGLRISDKQFVRICTHDHYSFNNNEYWMYINGIGSTQEIYQINADYLEKLFKVHIEGVYNRTDSIWMDVIEAFIDKETNIPNEPVLLTLPKIINALYKYKKVVVIAHSQGTLIISQVLRMLKEYDLNDLITKLEIYAFGNVATSMKYIYKNYPYIETINNEFDFFTKLGNNIKHKELKKFIDTDGEIYYKKNGYGHLLNINYLNGFDPEYTNKPIYINNKGQPSKLYTYIKSIKN